MLNWSGFDLLPGDPRLNFEKLCRSLVRVRYGQYGRFLSLANQPGVEFHLELTESCDLGARPRWYGWQCRWYELPRARALGTTRRRGIVEAIRKSESTIPGLSDWVLWTRYPLTSADQKWYVAQEKKSGLRLHLWTSDDVERLLTGDGEVLRHTYFGELVLLPAELKRLHEEATKRVQKRWLAEAHQVVEAEATLQRMLASSGAWQSLDQLSELLGGYEKILSRAAKGLPSVMRGHVSEVSDTARVFHNFATSVSFAIRHGNYDVVREICGQSRVCDWRAVNAALRLLRRANAPASLVATNAASAARRVSGEIDRARAFLDTGFVAVVADAGCGKTQLAVQLTVDSPERPAGILLFGRDLASGRTIDDLARSITVRGRPVATIELLIAALDAAGQRAARRLPLVIDGLNEAEDPRRWKDLLAPLELVLRRYPHVLLVCTLRSGASRPGHYEYRRAEQIDKLPFVEESVPAGVQLLEIPDFGKVSIDAIRKYFKYYKIEARDADLPIELLRHPLTLRIFCQVTNPNKKQVVGVEAMPRSLDRLFQGYMQAAVDRVAELALASRRFHAQDIQSAIHKLGVMLWHERSRSVSEETYRSEIHDAGVPWGESLVNLLEQEGVVLRWPGGEPGKHSLIPLYDALGGYLIAQSLIAIHSRDSFSQFVTSQETISLLAGEWGKSHPLATDIFRSLATLYPHTYHAGQLWQVLGPELRESAILWAARLEAGLIDAATVQEVAGLIREGGATARDLLRASVASRAAKSHPLDSTFLSSVLVGLPMSKRDLIWSEWIRENRDDIGGDVASLGAQWRRESSSRSRSDELRATWLLWVLTTNIRKLRREVCRALYWYGRAAPKSLFDLLQTAQSVDDVYVLEGILAAAYGVAMAVPRDSSEHAADKALVVELARHVWLTLLSPRAKRPTTYLCAMDHARGIFELGCVIDPTLRGLQQKSEGQGVDEQVEGIPWESVRVTGDTNSISRKDSPFRMDFENYTIGRLVPKRRNYDYDNEAYRLARERVLWRVHQLGWNAKDFAKIDEDIGAGSWNRFDGRDSGKVDRYGKKYSWIAYYELFGWMLAKGLLSETTEEQRSSFAEFDPNYPHVQHVPTVFKGDLLAGPQRTIAQWIRSGPVPDLRPILRIDAIGMDHGPWVSLAGHVLRQDEARGRKVFAFIRSFLVARSQSKEFVRRLKLQRMTGRWLPEIPEAGPVYAGEVPWAGALPDFGPGEFDFVVRERELVVTRKIDEYYLDGKKVNLSIWDSLFLSKGVQIRSGASRVSELSEEDLQRLESRPRLVAEKVVERDKKRMEAWSPVVQLRGFSPEEEGGSRGAPVVAKKYCSLLSLHSIPGTYDLRLPDGRRATYSLASRDSTRQNDGQITYMREEVLERLLKSLKMDLVWGVWGERELSVRQFQRREASGLKDCPAYKDFQYVSEFASGKGRRIRTKPAPKGRNSGLKRKAGKVRSGR